jgi:CheY-like chemotaxis protein
MMPSQTVLVVEDDPFIAEVLQNMLEEEGYAVLLAGDGDAALVTLGTVQPAVILSDIRMPGMDGLALCAALQTHPTQHATPVILMSASNRPPHDTCATAFLRKPFRIETVLDLVAHVIAQPQ